MLEEFFTYEKLYLTIFSLIVIVAVFLAKKLVSRSINSFCEKAKLEKNIRNLLRMVSDIVLYAVGITIILQAWGLPTEWFISISALSGAAVGFASTQTRSNFLTGFYIMTTRPFEVDDYVKIYTPSYILLEIPNRIVLNSSITRCMNDEGLDCSFPMCLLLGVS